MTFSENTPGAHATIEALILTMAIFGSGCTRKAEKADKASGDLVRLVPTGATGYRPQGQSKTFDRKSIFKHLDGGAEVYLDYGFKLLAVQEYVRPKNPKITLHIFDMGRAKDAYGIFTHEQEGRHAGIGEDSDYAGGLLRFWRGKYFTSIFSSRPDPTVERAIMELGRSVAARIKRRGRRPAIVSYFPPDGLKPRSTRYLHTHPTLLHHLSVGDDNPLGLSRRTEVAVAEYHLGSTRLAALVAVYPGTDRPARALDRLTGPNTTGGQPSGRDPIRVEARSCGRALVAVFSSGPAEVRKKLLQQLTNRIPECNK